jgi:sulfatase modifying factor 1
MLRQRGKASLAVLSVMTAGAVVGLACGLDAAGTREPPAPEVDASVPVDASPIPRPDGGGDGGGGGDAGDAAAPRGCPSARGPMVLGDAGGPLFCIDSTEVTNAEYDLFLTATAGGMPSALDAGVPTGCEGNLSFLRFGVAVDPPTYPVARIDWCDAHAFCQWAGKRLCGKTIAGDAGTGEWFNACSNGGQLTHPYGNAYVAGACNEDATGLGVVQPVGSHPGCEGGLPGLYDMNGNLEELIDNCGPTTCSAVGGYYYAPVTGCRVVREVTKAYVGAELGFRCCAEPE